MATAFFHRQPVDLDELVDHAGGRCARPGDHRGTDSEAVHRIGAQGGDRVLIEVSRHHDLRAGGAEIVELSPYLAGQHAQIAGVDPHRTQSGSGGGDRVGHSTVDVIGVDEQGRADPESGDLGAKRGLLPVIGPAAGGGVHHGEGVRGGAQCGEVVALCRREVGGCGEAGDVGGPGGRDGGLLVGAPGPHLDQRPVIGHAHHPGGRRGHRTVVVEDRQRQRLQYDAFGEGPGDRQDRRAREIQLSFGVAVDVPAEPEVAEVIQRRGVEEARQRRQRGLVEDEIGQRLQESAGTGDHAVAPAVGQAPGEHLEGGAPVRGAVPQCRRHHGQFVFVGQQCLRHGPGHTATVAAAVRGSGDCRRLAILIAMGAPSAPTHPGTTAVRETDEVEATDAPWITLVWDDPVNLMNYVTYVLQKLFGYSEPHATKLMLQVHTEGKAVVSAGSRESMEVDVSKLHAAGLWATMQQDR